MPLKLVLDSLEGLSEEMKALYKQGGDGKFHLQAEEDEDGKKKIAEFRDNNIKLQKELEAIKKQFAGIDLDKIEDMKKRLQQIDDKKMIEAGKIDELVAQKVERMKADFEAQIAQMKTALEEKDKGLQSTTQRLSEVLIDGEITKAVTAAGVVRKSAMEDILARGRKTWKLEDGKPVPKEGDRLLYGKDGKAPLTFEEWAQALLTTAPFLFEASAGGGAGGGADKGAGGFAGGKPDLAKMPPQERLKYIHGGSGGQK